MKKLSNLLNEYHILILANYEKFSGLLKHPKDLLESIFEWVVYNYARKLIPELKDKLSLEIPEWANKLLTYGYGYSGIDIISFIAREDLVSSFSEFGDKFTTTWDEPNLPDDLKFSLKLSKKPKEDAKRDEYGPIDEYQYLYSIYFKDNTVEINKNDLDYDSLYRAIGNKINNLHNRIEKYKDKFKNIEYEKEYFSINRVEYLRLLKLCESISKNNELHQDTRSIKAVWKTDKGELYVQLFFDTKFAEKHFSVEPWQGLYQDQRTGNQTPTISLLAEPDSISVEEFKEKLQQLKTTLRHELQHYLQFTSRPGKELIGLPSKKIRDNSNVDIHGTPIDSNKTIRIEHALRDVEFYTRLSDEVDKFINKYQNYPDYSKLQLAKATVGLPMDIDAKKHPSFAWTSATPFFSILQEHQPEKWKKAMKEFFKAIGVLE